MHAQELKRRQARAKHEPWIIAETENGHRIHSPTSGGRPYLVTGIPDAPQCTCLDYQSHAEDSMWRCKHILAVEARFGDATSRNAIETGSSRFPIPAAQPSVLTRPGQTQMLLKRSVSPDGRIDALSVEFTCPVEEGAAEAIASQAEYLLKLQKRIVERFLNGTPRARTPALFAESPAEGQSAHLLRIGGADGKWGRRLFFTIQANGQVLRLYGSQKQLAEHLKGAGYLAHAGNVREDVQLGLPCRILTEPGKNGFVKVVKVLPPSGVR